MYLNKKNLFLVISILLIFFFLTYNDVKSQETKIIEGNALVVDGDTIKINGENTFYAQNFRANDTVKNLALANTLKLIAKHGKTGFYEGTIANDLVDKEFIKERVNNFNELKERVADFTPEKASEACGISPELISEVAIEFAKSKGSMILWGMGVSQHVHGTDNARCLIALSTITGQIGRPGTGVHLLSGQNNVQGASDAGLIPMMLPDYQKVADNEKREWFESFWGTELHDKPGFTVTEIMDKVFADESDAEKSRGLYVMGENPAMSDPNANHAREALARLEILIVQDIFLTETAYLADIVLPASAFPEKTGTFTNTDRRVQLAKKAVNPPGKAKQDLWIIQELAKRMGLNWNYKGPDEVYDELSGCMESLKNINKLGITSGASAPEELVKEIISYCKGFGFSLVEEIQGLKENISFKLPKELR